MSERLDLNLDIPTVARVEGEGGLRVRLRRGRVEELQLRIFEPPRLFEQFLAGRAWHEVPDLVARICGICPVAYQMSAVHALEAAFGVDPGPWVRDMRRLFYCGEWIESHALHIHLLAAPDFLGYADVIALSRDHAAAVRRGLRLQSLGNRIIALLGARSVHPVGARVGGFARAPRPAEAAALAEELRGARDEARALVAWCADLELPAVEQGFTSVALRHPHEYPMNAGRIVSDAGLDIAPEDWEHHFREFQVPWSTALHAQLAGEPYLVGPLARLNLNHDRLPPEVARVAAATGIRWPSANPYHSIVARAVELLYALTEALRLLEAYRPPAAPAVTVSPRAGGGVGATEAPRGLLWHRYTTGADGALTAARIVPPTSQNQARIEADLVWHMERLGAHGGADPEAARRLCETVIRNYDPCISCATHFLTLDLDAG